MVKKFVGVPREEIIRSGGYEVPSWPTSMNLTVGGMKSAADGLTGLEIRPSWRVPTLHRFNFGNPVQLTRALPLSAPSSREIVLGIVVALFLYDFYFYLPHIALHKVS